MKYATKLKASVKLPNLPRHSKIIASYGEGKNQDFTRLVLKYLPRKQKEIIEEFLPKELHKHLIGIVYSSIQLLSPHLHTLELSVINLYQRTSGETTIFYEGEIEITDNISSDHGHDFINVNRDKIIPIEHFVAQDGDIWVLDTTQPHSVSIDNTGDEKLYELVSNGRDVIQIYLNASYKDVVEQLTLKNLINDES